jgi:hypothetical protein
MPIQAPVSRPGSSTGAFFGSFLVGWERERVEEFLDVVPERAREFVDRVLVAMLRRYPRAASPPRRTRGQ